MPRGVSHDEEFGRVSGKEMNVFKTHEGWGPSKRFENKSQLQNPTTSGGINRPVKGSAGGKGRTYTRSAQ